MDMREIIEIKRNGGVLTPSELKFFVQGYVSGEIPDYQAAALLMAVYFQKLSSVETAELTNLMRYSGDTVDLSGIPGIKVDKHSTGGVGDKTTLIVAPLVAACGVPVAKMSGRGLGFTGGTIDKLESIPGFETVLEPALFLRQVKETGIAVIGQSGRITPADKKMYALRDVTGTVDNESLIAASVMSKKLAAGSDAIVLDVKCGSGSFMKNAADAKHLAEIMIEIGAFEGKKMAALISDMSEPLGRAVGNSIEVIEAIEVLRGEGPADIEELSLQLAGVMVHLGGRVESVEEGVELAGETLKEGRGLEKFAGLIEAQGGNPEVCRDTSLLKTACVSKEVIADTCGYIGIIDGETVGTASVHAGAGREKKGDAIDSGAGILLERKVGDFVETGDKLATVYASNEEKAADAAAKTGKAYRMVDRKPEMPELIHELICTKN